MDSNSCTFYLQANLNMSSFVFFPYFQLQQQDDNAWPVTLCTPLLMHSMYQTYPPARSDFISRNFNWMHLRCPQRLVCISNADTSDT